jgi:hypothetical protein
MCIPTNCNISNHHTSHHPNVTYNDVTWRHDSSNFSVLNNWAKECRPWSRTHHQRKTPSSYKKAIFNEEEINIALIIHIHICICTYTGIKVNVFRFFVTSILESIILGIYVNNFHNSGYRLAVCTKNVTTYSLTYIPTYTLTVHIRPDVMSTLLPNLYRWRRYTWNTEPGQ